MSFGTDPLMERFPVFRSRDPEETRFYIEGEDFRFDMHPREAGLLDAQCNGVRLPNMYLGYIQYGSPVVTSATRSNNVYWIQVLLRGEIEIAAGKDILDLNTACAAITSPLSGPVVRSGPGSARLHVSVKQEAMVRHLAVLLGEPIGQPLEFASVMPIDRGYGRSVVESLRTAAADADYAEGILSNPIARSAFEQFVLTALLLSHPHNYAEGLRRRGKPLSPRDLKRAVDYIEANLGEPIGLPDIVAASGVPGRTLLKHFRDFRGTSPMRHLRQARFRTVHQALRRASHEEGVMDIAATHGFTHMGRFSIEYRKLFGETPSDTLKRGRNGN
jgi:AraC-like DNA-binding protein